MPDDPLAKYLAALEHAGDAVEITDADVRIEYVNPAWERQMGWARQEALGRTPAELFRAGQHPDEFYGVIEAEISAGRIWRGEITGRRRDGTFFPQHMTVSPLRDAEGRITHCVAIKRDITVLKQTQAAAMLADRISSMGTMAAGVGHEINNPLAALLANLEFVRDSLAEARVPADPGLRDELSAALDESIESAVRIRDIVADLRSFSRADDATCSAVRARSAVEAAMRIVSNEVRHRATLTVEHGDVPAVWANEGRLVHLLVNLLMNAVQALPVDDPGSQRIAVRVRRGVRSGACIEVSDTGVGIPPEHMPRIFDPFFTTKPVGVGTGLGLSICHSIVSSLGGTIHATSEPGRGTTFTVSFPPPPEDTRTAGPVPESSGDVRRLRVLVIDDEPLVCRAVRRMLSGVDVTLCASGDDAIAPIVAGAFDAVLCDLMMPGKSGMDIYDRVRERDPAMLPRFVFMTGGAFTPHAEKFLATVPNPTLHKPFDAGTLRSALGSVLRPP